MGDRREVWTLQSDGTGVKRLDAGEGSDGRKVRFQWSLEGRNLTVESEEGGETSYYRVESWSTRQLRLHVYASEAVLIFQSADDSTPRRRPRKRRRSPER